MTTLLWYRRDLRLHDHPALLAAHEDGDVLPVFCLDPDLLAHAGAVRTACLLRALRSLRDATDGALVVREGDPRVVIPALAEEYGATAVHITAETEPYGRRRDAAVEDALFDVPLVRTGTPYAVGPGSLLTGGGTPYKVFTPFAKAWRDHGWPAPAPLPPVTWARGEGVEIPADPELPTGLTLPDVTEEGARAAWARFVEEDLEGYVEGQNRPDLDATSRMSVPLKWGLIHPRTLLADLGARPRTDAVTKYGTELAWREFYADVLWHNPDSALADLNPLPLDYDDPGEEVEAWKEGRTGYPIVDAGMRQLLAEGWMHNRVRMITASFLLKDLHVWWPIGAAHFMAHLADGDVASNQHGWQWVAGTGTDASPYFRVFNPVLQGVKFDPDGEYVRRWVPELRHLPGKSVHEPWKVPGGYAHGYPEPIVDHAEERAETLRRYEVAKAR